VSAATTTERKPFGWRFTAPLLLGSTLNPINSSMLATALVGIGVDMHTGPGATATLVSVLYLCSAVAQPTMGKLSTIFGPRRIFLAGVIILLLGGVVGTLAPTFGFLVLSRALLGIGTSAAYPTGMALVRKRADTLGTGVPGRVLGNFSIAAQVTIVIGLPLGGILAGAFGWRALFFVNIPLAIVVLTFTLLGVAKDDSMSSEGFRSIVHAIDIPGIALFAGAIIALLVFLGDLTSPIWWLLGLSAALFVGLGFWERHQARPLIDVRMLAANRPLQRTYLRQFLTQLASYTVLYGISQWMEQGRGLGPETVGLVLIPYSLVSIVIARVISGKGWVRWPLILAAVVLVALAGVMLFINSESSILALVGMSLIVGVINGFNGFGSQATLYLQAPAAEIAVASGLLRTAAYVGAIFSSSLIGLTFGSAATDAGLHVLAWVFGGLGVVLVALTVFDRSIPRVTNEEPG
jgi:predicted MFS family arabinose efflux permease